MLLFHQRVETYVEIQGNGLKSLSPFWNLKVMRNDAFTTRTIHLQSSTEIKFASCLLHLFGQDQLMAHALLSGSEPK